MHSRRVAVSIVEYVIRNGEAVVYGKNVIALLREEKRKRAPEDCRGTMRILKEDSLQRAGNVQQQMVAGNGTGSENAPRREDRGSGTKKTGKRRERSDR